MNVARAREGFIDATELSRRTSVPSITWETLRDRDAGPPYYRLDKNVVYRWSEVERWLAEDKPSGVGQYRPSLREEVYTMLASLRCPGPHGKGFVYALRCDLVGLVKIGKSETDDPWPRIAELERMNAAPLRLLALGHGGYLESSIHSRHAKSRRHGEWFAIEDNPFTGSGAKCFTCHGYR